MQINVLITEYQKFPQIFLAYFLLKGYINKIEDNFYLGYREAFRRLQKDFRPAEASCPDWLR